jgi:spermidine/putrescine transport system substrate-binding protein
MGLAGMAGCTPSTERRLNVFNWSDYVAPETIPGFEAEFGVRVQYATYESNEELLAKVTSGNSGWDVVFPSNYVILPLVENQLLAPLDHSKLPDLDHLAKLWRNPVWDPNLEWCVPYMWGGTGIIFSSAVTPGPRSWADLWSDRYSQRLTMLDDPAEVLGACLLKLGYSVNSIDPAEIEQAKQEAIAQKQYLRAYLNAEVQDQLVAGDILAAQLWATTAVLAIQANRQLDFVYPQEGFPLYTDCAVILRESAQRDLAHDFLSYLLRPEVAATAAARTQTATVNAGALERLPEELRRNPTLFPPEETLRRGEWFEALPAEAQQLRDRIWTEIKSA